MDILTTTASLIIILSSIMASLAVFMYNYGFCVLSKTANRRQIIRFIIYSYMEYTVAMLSAYAGLTITRQEPVQTFTVISLLIFAGSVYYTICRYIKLYGQCLPPMTLFLIVACYFTLLTTALV